MIPITVKQIQLLLLYLGYDPGDPDGILGKNTRGAIRAFQEDNGLTVDGVAGDMTQGALLEAVYAGRFSKAKDTQSAAQTAPPKGSQGEQAKTGTFWDDIRYFSRDDPFIGCSCGQCGGFPVEPSEKLMRLADKVRTAAGRPMVPTSTVRCDAHNRAVGGVDTSRHKKGTAMDFCIPGMSAGQALEIVRGFPEVVFCYAIDGSAVHMDVG